MSGKTTLSDLREMNIRKQRESREPQENQSYDGVTDKQISNIESNTNYLPESHTVSSMASREGSRSVRDTLVQTMQGGADLAKPVLKTVTLKMDPVLDKRVEDHCYQMGRKKQDVVRDALLLYFETIEAIQAETEGA